MGLKILVTGGTGFIGRHLVSELERLGHDLTVIARTKRDGSVSADTAKPGEWQKLIPEHDVIINLTGASIARFWSRKGKQLIYESRIETTSNIVAAITPGTTLISASGISIYGDRGDEVLTEQSSIGDGFLADVARDWENEALKAANSGCRVVITRFGQVLGADGGMLPQIIRLCRLGLCCPWGSGWQWFSWIHIDDLVRAIIFLLQTEDASGTYNLTAPEPVQNHQFFAELKKQCKFFSLLPSIPALALKLALGELSSVFLSGQRVKPEKLLMHGFNFRYPSLDAALANLCQISPKSVIDVHTNKSNK